MVYHTSPSNSVTLPWPASHAAKSLEPKAEPFPVPESRVVSCTNYSTMVGKNINLNSPEFFENLKYILTLAQTNLT